VSDERNPRNNGWLARMAQAWTLALAVGMLAGSAAADQPSASGQWRQVDDRTGEVRSIITIAERNGSYHGMVSQIFPRPGEDPNPICSACTGKLRDTSVRGFPLLSGMKRDGLDYSGGTIIDPESGSVYRAKMTLNPDGKTLVVRGFIGIPLLGRSQTWSRLR
jgi:uncharacterized protein (DUF2147 family)